MNSWEIYIDTIIQSCIQFISERSTFESIQDPIILSLLESRLMTQIDIRQDLIELMFEYIRKFYGIENFFLDQASIDSEVMQSLSRRLMDGFYTYRENDPVEKDFRKYINFLVCSVAFHIIKS